MTLPAGNAARMNDDLATAQTLKYAAELRDVYVEERKQRQAVEGALKLLEDSYATTVRALASALELRDDATGSHAERVASLGLRLADRMSPELVDNPQLEYGFLLHDIGKIGVPDAILLKPGPLTKSEIEVMREHTWLGERIVARIPYLNGLAREVVAGHHERWDGEGYPRRLAETQIPLAARLFSVVDAFDAMTNDRPYRQALPLEVAVGEIEARAGTQFDPDVTEAFLGLLRELPDAA
jgi:HD-GYP domain-containing protein (c-di-GMP phosphodiesterase class II)